MGIRGTALLDTAGGEIERWGRGRDLSGVVALWAITALKAGSRPQRPSSAASTRSTGMDTGRTWIAADLLNLYGAALTLPGLLIEASLLDVDEPDDPTAPAARRAISAEAAPGRGGRRAR